MHATLLHDAYTVPVFSGSCGVVAHYLRKTLEALGYAVTERSVPLTDKTSVIDVPAMPGDPAENVRVIFEELFVRCADTPAFRATKNVSFFNLMAGEDMAKQARADLVIMNSRFMANAFPIHLARLGVACPPTTWVPLPLPLFDYPRGYPSPGRTIAAPELRALERSAFIGHAIRPYKMNCFATMSILHHLNVLAEKAGTKPYVLVVSHLDYERCERELPSLPLPADVLEHMDPIPHVDNPTVVALMRRSSFGLCYDDFVEPFGYYPIESVFLGCPVFTNGSGNLRHLLPKGHGIRVRESLDMHFGSLEQRRDAYRAVAREIVRDVTSGARARECVRGRALLRARHRPEHFTQAVGSQLDALLAGRVHQRAAPRRLRRSPYLRLADWEQGRFVTDHGIVSSEPRARSWKAALDEHRDVGREPADAFDDRVVCR